MRRNGAQYSASNTGVIGEVGGKRPYGGAALQLQQLSRAVVHATCRKKDGHDDRERTCKQDAPESGLDQVSFGLVVC